MSLGLFLRIAFVSAGVVFAVGGVPSSSYGQAYTPGGDDLLNQLRRQETEAQGGAVNQRNDATQSVEAPTTTPTARELLTREQKRQQPVSRIETDYLARINAAAPEALELPRAPADLDRQPTQLLRGERKDGTAWPAKPTPAISQFGYNIFDQGGDLFRSGLMGAVADEYVLGIGDEVVVTLRGQRNVTLRTAIDRSGRLTFLDLAPVSAAGRPFGEVRDEIKAQAESKFLQTEAYVSVGLMRNIMVYVLGEVGEPGPHRLTGLSGLLEAIVASGGIRKTGSLREVRLVRGQTTRTIDLYDLIFTGHLPANLTLAEGDRIFVPPLSATVAIAGEVRRPGVYEIGDRRLTVRDALTLAGGPLRPDGYRYLKISADSAGRDQAVDILHALDAPLAGGSILLLLKSKGAEIGGFSVDGHVVAPGVRSLISTPNLSSLMSDTGIFQDNPYMLFAVLQRTDEVTRARNYIGVDLTRVRSGLGDVEFHQNDRLIVLSLEDVRYLSSADVQAVLSGRRPPSLIQAEQRATARATAREAAAGQSAGAEDYSDAANPKGNAEPAPEGVVAEAKVCRGLKVLSALVQTSSKERFANALQLVATTTPQTTEAEMAREDRAGTRKQQRPVANTTPCPVIFETHPELLPFVVDHAVTVQGEVQVPGVYPLVPMAPLASLVAEAGGLSRDADTADIEITHFSDERQKAVGPDAHRHIDSHRTPLQQAVVSPGDNVRFNPTFSGRDTGPVSIRGEVKRPGFYNIYRGESLSALIERAGGLTEEAYPLGTVFTRQSLKEQERRSNEMAAERFQGALGTAALSNTGQSDNRASMLASLQILVDGIRNAPALGRLAVEADPTILQVRPEVDTVLDAGDDVFVPKRPNTVSVLGEVLNPGSIAFNVADDPSTYISKAGGFTQSADDSRVFVVLPNGQARPAKVSSWNLVSTPIPPGSIIVVPRDAMPFNGWGFTKDLFSVASSAAISAASLAVISK